MKPVALYAFSADPITFGHINIVERIVRTFGSCLVVIGRNPNKKYLFSLDERCLLVEQSLSHLSNVTVVSCEGMIVDFARENGIKVIVKGIRNAADLEYEHIIHQVGVTQKLGIETHLLFADPKLAHISSSVVKALQVEHGDYHEYTPAVVKVALENRISNQLIIGITGSIASGKSTLAKQLLEQADQLQVSAHHIDMDTLAHDILNGHDISEHLHQEVITSLRNLFGKDLIINGQINRKQIADFIFVQPSLREQLNQILSLPMNIMLRKRLRNCSGIILLEGALLPDLNLLHLCNYRCILCTVPEQDQITRMVEARNYSMVHAQARLSSQLTNAEKKSAIMKAIDKHNFGTLWISTSLVPANLLTILYDCGVNEKLETV